MLGDYDSRRARSRGRIARYSEHVERLREIAKMETQPRVRARLLELAEQYEELVDDLAGTRPTALRLVWSAGRAGHDPAAYRRSAGPSLPIDHINVTVAP